MTAGDVSAGSELHEGGPRSPARIGGEGAALEEDTVIEAQGLAGCRSRNAPRETTGADPRDGGDQASRVGIARMIQDLGGRSQLHELARVEHADAIGELGHRGEVVRDEHDGRSDLAVQRPHELQDVRLHDDVEGRGRLIHQEHVRLAAERHGDHDPLLHPPAELVGKGGGDARRVVELDQPEQLVGALAGPLAVHAEMPGQDFGDLRAHRHGRVQGGGRILVDHGDAAAADPVEGGPISAQQIHAGMDNAAGFDDGIAGEVVHDGEERRRLARARLAHQSHDLVGVQGEGELLDGGEEHAPHGEAHREVPDLDQGIRHRGESAGGEGDRAGLLPAD